MTEEQMARVREGVLDRDPDHADLRARALDALSSIERELLAARDVVEAARAAVGYLDGERDRRRWWDLRWLQGLRSALSSYDAATTGG